MTKSLFVILNRRHDTITMVMQPPDSRDPATYKSNPRHDWNDLNLNQLVTSLFAVIKSQMINFIMKYKTKKDTVYIVCTAIAFFIVGWIVCMCYHSNRNDVNTSKLVQGTIIMILITILLFYSILTWRFELLSIRRQMWNGEYQTR